MDTCQQCRSLAAAPIANPATAAHAAARSMCAKPVGSGGPDTHTPSCTSADPIAAIGPAGAAAAAAAPAPAAAAGAAAAVATATATAAQNTASAPAATARAASTKSASTGPKGPPPPKRAIQRLKATISAAGADAQVPQRRGCWGRRPTSFWTTRRGTSLCGHTSSNTRQAPALGSNQMASGMSSSTKRAALFTAAPW
ncbi:hypothetical protein TSOC_001197 [Tetrabaena socialis]|uniref:Uncharacterized protein n=1 Tax=Tetrabaena socialis TaxID=47790 RepID=A0A2J8AHA2_9CHLO|nr:hypothetical protein TSOC_001197 [Tetrabaena socialis]|eukprot:PNH11897.1 hypothetical protein TSOC_001197 [Tetrabaena socialis]